MNKKTRKTNLSEVIVQNEIVFWILAILLSAATVGFFLIPFLIAPSSPNPTIPPMSYLSILFFFLCFWLIKKKTEPHK